MFGTSTKRNMSRSREYLIATITDLPGRGSLSGEKTKGYTGCVKCLDDTDAVNLPNNSKIVYMGHHRFLPKGHPYRMNRKRLAPKYRDGPAILRELNKLEVVLGKWDNVVAAPDGSVWKKIGFLETTLLGISECTPLS